MLIRLAEYIVAALLESACGHGIELQDKSIGIIGVGNVGSRVEAKCRALGMVPVLNDPPLQRKTNEQKYRSIEELFDCDFITLHTPLTEDGPDKTLHLANADFFNSLKNGVVFLNSSRGGVADTDAIKQAIKSGKVRAAALDVWEGEPDIDIELLEMVDIGTAHIAGYSYDGKVAGMIMIYESLCKCFNLEAINTIHDFLPEPKQPEITITPSKNEQEDLRNLVQKLYDIKSDSVNLKRIINMANSDRPGAFDRLRKEYPVRREFQNTLIKIAGENAQRLRMKAVGIGFKNG